MLDRALAFGWSVADSAADEVERVPQGTVLRTPSLPDAWSLNCLRLEGPHPGLTLTDAEALAAARVPGLPYRHLLVEDEATADRLEPSARAAGWEIDRELTMALTGPPGRAVDTGAVREASLEELLDLIDAWNVEDGDAPDDATRLQLREMSRREHTVLEERRLVVEDAGRPVATTTVRLGDGVAQIEDVYALPGARGRGHGRALVTRAVEIARAGDPELVFIIADADGRPRELYASVGFTPLARSVVLHRPPA